MFYGLMDNLMSLCNMDVERVWTYREARNEILAGFADCAEADYNYLPESLTTGHLLNYAATLGTKGIVEKMVHTMLYPAHTFLNESVWLTVYPFEKALAEFLGRMLEELKEE